MSKINPIPKPRTVIDADFDGARYSRVLWNLSQDRRISPKAKGIMLFVLSMPHDWEHSIDSIAAAHDGIGYDYIQSGTKELERFGYLRRLPVDSKLGHQITRNIWFHVPLEPGTENPSSVKSETGDGKSTAGTGDGFPGPGKAVPSETILSETNAAATGSCIRTETDRPGGKTALETSVPVSPPSSPSGEGVGGDPLAGSPEKKKTKEPTLPLKTKLTAGELRQAQLAKPALHPLALWQIADLYEDWRSRKTTFEILPRKKGKDITKRRESHPDEPDWQWFAEEVSGFREWKKLIEAMTNPNTRTPEAVAAVDARQVETIGMPPRDWLEETYRSLFGRDPEKEFQLDKPPMPQGWRDLPLWHQCIVLGTYVPGPPRPAPLPAKPKAPVVGSTVSRSDQVAASRKAFPGMHSPQDLADKRAVEASTAARLQSAKAAPLKATPPATQPAPVLPPEPSYVDPSPEPDPDDIFADPIPPAPSTPAA